MNKYQKKRRETYMGQFEHECETIDPDIQAHKPQDFWDTALHFFNTGGLTAKEAAIRYMSHQDKS